MAIVRYITAEDKSTQPVYALDAEWLKTHNVCQSAYEECLERASISDGVQCWMYEGVLTGYYVDASGKCDIARYMKDAFDIESANGFDGWSYAGYYINGTPLYVEKWFDAKNRLVYQAVKQDDPLGWFNIAVMAGISIIAGAALAPIATQIGNAVLGPTLAAEYPALAKAIGTTVVQTAKSGGDVESAVKSAAAGYLGPMAGDFVGSWADSELIGKVATNVASAAIKDGNIAMGAASALLPAGITVLGDLAKDFLSVEDIAAAADAAKESTTMDDYGLFDASYEVPSFNFDSAPLPDFSDFAAVDIGNGFDFSFDWGTPVNNFNPTFSSDMMYAFNSGGYTFDNAGTYDPNNFQVADPEVSWSEPSFPDVALPDPSVFLPDFQVETGSSSGSGGGWFENTDWAAVVGKLGTIALQVWQQTGQKNIKSVNQSVRLPDGSIQAVQKNGTVITTSPSGQSSVTQLPVGQPYRFPDGTMVINNGNGTYTRQEPNGQVSTMPLTQGGAGSMFSGPISAPLALGGALLLMLALRR